MDVNLKIRCELCTNNIPHYENHSTLRCNECDVFCHLCWRCSKTVKEITCGRCSRSSKSQTVKSRKQDSQSDDQIKTRNKRDFEGKKKTPLVSNNNSVFSLTGLEPQISRSAFVIDSLHSRNRSAQRNLVGKRNLTRSGEKWESGSKNVLKQVKLDFGLISWNINHFNNTPVIKTNSILRVFSQHEWLDAMALQEINATAKVSLDKGLVYKSGPKMAALSILKKPPKNKKTAKSFEGLSNGKNVWLKPSQQEFYPLVYRKNSILKYSGCSVFHAGKLIEIEEQDIMNQPFYWSKKLGKKQSEFKDEPEDELQEEDDEEYESVEENRQIDIREIPDCRPIIIHKLEVVKGQFVYVGIVHTTPRGSGLGRQGEFEQIQLFLNFISKSEENWIIAGDYYLDPESTVASNSNTKNRPVDDLFESKIEDLNLRLAISVSATNQTKLTEKVNKSIKDNPKKNLKDRAARIYIVKKKKITKYVVNKRADFFICTPNFGITHTGLVSPKSGVLPVDPNHNALNWWMEISDHAPVGGVFCTSSDSKKLSLIKELDMEANEMRWKKAKNELDHLKKQALQKIDETLVNLWYFMEGRNDRNVDLDEMKIVEYFEEMSDFCDFLEEVLDDETYQGLFKRTVLDKSVIQKTSAKSDGKVLIKLLEDYEKEDTTEFEDVTYDLSADEMLSFAVQDLLPALRLLGYEIEDFDITSEKETYEDFDNKRKN